MADQIIIVGGGANGLSAALCFAAHGLPVHLIDATDPTTFDRERFDGRALSLAPTSVKLFKSLGVWEKLADVAQPMHDILVTDGRLSDGAAPLFLHFEREDAIGGAYAHMVENRHLTPALMDAAAENPLVTITAPAMVEKIERRADGMALTLNTGAVLETPLLVAADGKFSKIRQDLGFKTMGWDYDQKGIVTTVVHERPHHGVAQEYFMPGGPFAILPLCDDEQGRHRASLVWTERTKMAETLIALDEDAFADELRKRFGDYLGQVDPIGPRFSYPLMLMQAQDFAAPHVALLGDAAHVVHPLAGMGLNLGLRDAAALAECVADAAQLGLGLGTDAALRRYEKWRRADTTAMAVVTDGLNRLFSNDVPPLRIIRDLGLGLVDRIKPVKKALSRAATGDMGTVPKLMKG